MSAGVSITRFRRNDEPRARAGIAAPARMTADSRYALYVNGREVSRSPIRSQPRRLHYDVVDLASFLHQGENVVAVFLKYYGHPLSASDETWRARSGISGAARIPKAVSAAGANSSSTATTRSASPQPSRATPSRASPRAPVRSRGCAAPCPHRTA